MGEKAAITIVVLLPILEKQDSTVFVKKICQ
jgi:hypothetical protein